MHKLFPESFPSLNTTTNFFFLNHLDQVVPVHMFLNFPLEHGPFIRTYTHKELSLTQQVTIGNTSTTRGRVYPSPITALSPRKFLISFQPFCLFVFSKILCSDPYVIFNWVVLLAVLIYFPSSLYILNTNP